MDIEHISKPISDEERAKSHKEFLERSFKYLNDTCPDSHIAIIIVTPKTFEDGPAIYSYSQPMILLDMLWTCYQTMYRKYKSMFGEIRTDAPNKNKVN